MRQVGTADAKGDNRARRAGWNGWPWVVILAMLVVTAVAMRLEGRLWWCACGEFRPWITDVWTSHCSQHLADPYSITHMSHGLIFWAVLAGWARWFPRWCPPARWWLCISVGIAAAWEVLENSPFIIERYRAATMSLEYLGDSIVNAIGDVASCALGFYFARWAGWKWALGLFVVTELVLLVLIRDNLTLNVLMLLWPVRAIKEWQTVGHAPA